MLSLYLYKKLQPRKIVPKMERIAQFLFRIKSRDVLLSEKLSNVSYYSKVTRNCSSKTALPIDLLTPISQVFKVAILQLKCKVRT